MSTTPSPSEVRYTVVGERARGNSGFLSAIVLSRGGRQTRSEGLSRLFDAGLSSVIVVLGPGPQYDVEQLTTKHPNARFLLLARRVTPGEAINIAMREVETPYAVTLWPHMELASLTERSEEQIRALGALCVVPLLRSERGETVPSVIAPAFFRGFLRTIPTQPSSAGTLSLYAYADVAIYDRAKFLQSGGFDSAMLNPYWQRIDYGLRAFLWGERIVTAPTIRVGLTRALPPDDTTPDPSYARFHLKSLAVRFAGDEGRLPARKLIPFLFRSGLPLPTALQTFRSVRTWVRTNRFRFVQDARRVTELWEIDS